MFGVEANDPRVVVHLDFDRYRLGRLNDLVVVVVKAVGKHRRTGVATEPDDASFTLRACFIIKIGVRPLRRRTGRSPLAISSCTRLLAGDGLWNLAIWRGDERGAGLAVHPHDFAARIEPEIVVAADRPARRLELRPLIRIRDAV